MKNIEYDQITNIISWIRTTKSAKFSDKLNKESGKVKSLMHFEDFTI